MRGIKSYDSHGKRYFDLLGWTLACLLNFIVLCRDTQAIDITLEAEPYLGMNGWGHLKVANGTTDTTDPNNPTYPPLKSFDFSQNIGLGFRVNAIYENTYYIALDFVHFPKNVSSDSIVPSWNNSQFGLTGGAELPAIPWRFWIGFNFINTLEPQPYLTIAGINSAVGLLGTAFKVGSGIKLFSPIWLNFEMIYGQFSRYSNPNLQILPGTISTSYNYFFLSLSTPFSFYKLRENL